MDEDMAPVPVSSYLTVSVRDTLKTVVYPAR